ncbi:sugar-transfer associated ATP-grasp domain-containing protein [Nesterenkonia muleiensis]|uniref:sugar-transfer associated ATP-grasp domain-containing protein n=1 Tax=Nesterenkonia muleiensis TaxID=2282648 RepID=UPI000E750C52|nr:sugar-transfer associated ATP-grasp domain-containing protein [Nesterenkonia muleiensis]
MSETPSNHDDADEYQDAEQPDDPDLSDSPSRKHSAGFVTPGFARRAAARTLENLKDPAGVPSRAAKTYRYRRRQFGAGRRFLRKEFRWETEWSNRKPDWWRKGFLSRSVTLYGLEEGNDPSLYINDVQRYFRTKRMVSPHLQEVLNNKFSFFLLVKSLGLDSDVVDLLGLHTRGHVHPFPQSRRIPLEDFLAEALEERGHIFVKPLHGAEANGVRSMKVTEDGYRMDGRPSGIEEMADWVRDFPRPVLFEAAIVQHPEQAGLNPHSTNTIRLLTMPDVTGDHSPFIIRASQRIGSERSGHIDNWTKGGLSANVELETGILSAAAQLPEGDELQWFAEHPDSGARIQGHQVPFWEEAKELVLEAARRLAFMEYIGWDIVITESGPVILEANINSGMNVLQVHGPLLADPRAAAYYKARGVV